MLQTKIRNISNIIGTTNSLAHLYSRSLEIIKLQDAIRNSVGQPLSHHLYLADLYSDSLLLYTDSPAWAAKLRFSTSEILSIIKLIPGYQNVDTLRVKINPSLCKDLPKESRLAISSSTAQHLEKIAENINDNELQASLLKLAQNR
jgi:hypothetical protein